MSIWLDPTGLSSYGIGICDRCRKKFSILDLIPDGDIPGLRVCRECWDELDPYKLPARVTEDIALPFTRPDVPLTFDDEGDVIEFVIGTDDPQIAFGLDTDEDAIEATGVDS